MTPRLSRFLHLEKARAERPASDAESSRLQSGGRFEALEERREAPSEGAVPEAHLERFRGEAPVGLAETSGEEARRFPRCMHCHAENGRFAPTCLVCGVDLDTPEQRAFDEQLWQQRREGLTRTHREEQEALRKLGARRIEEVDAFHRQLEQLRAEERKYRWMRAFSEHSTVGTALLALIPDARARWLTLAGVVGVSLGLWRFGQGRVRLTGLALSLFLVLLFMPRKSRWRL